MIIYTDGSARPTNPSTEAGFGVVVLDNNKNLLYTYNKQYKEKEKILTNNQMELKAILYVMIKHGKDNEIPLVYSDSAYAINCLTNWCFSWERNNWLKSNNQVPENLDIIQTYYELYQMGYRINLKKCKGHSNDKYNDLADKLAKGELSGTK